MNGVSAQIHRPRTPPAMRRGDFVRFYGPDRYTQSTFDGNDETDSEILFDKIFGTVEDDKV